TDRETLGDDDAQDGASKATPRNETIEKSADSGLRRYDPYNFARRHRAEQKEKQEVEERNKKQYHQPQRPAYIPEPSQRQDQADPDKRQGDRYQRCVKLEMIDRR